MADPKWDALDLDDLARLRDKKLRRQLRYQLYAFSSHYRKLFDAAGVKADGFSGAGELSKLPLTDRAQLAEDPDSFVLKPTKALIQRWGAGTQIRRIVADKLFRGIEHADESLKNEYDPVQTLESAGTSGKSVHVRLSRRDLSILGTLGQRMLEVAGAGHDDKVLNLLDASNTGGFWAAWLGGVTMGLEQSAPGFLEPDAAHELAVSTSATVIVAPADQMLEIAAVGPLPALRTIILGPVSSGPVLLQRLKAAVGDHVKVIQTYHFAEGRAVWAECAEGAGRPDCGFHVSADFDLIEMISPRSLLPVKPKEPGEVVFTGLDHRGTALLRYRPGDVAMGGMVSGACPHCGRSVDRIIGPIRRVENLVELHLAGADPVALDVEVIADILSHPGLAAWQVEIGKTDGDPRGADELFVLFHEKSNKDPSRLAVELNDVFVKSLGFSPTQFVRSDRAKGGVVDLRPVQVLGPDAASEETPLVRLWRTPGQR